MNKRIMRNDDGKKAARRLVIGAGNEMRGDDGAGRAVAGAGGGAARAPRGVVVREIAGDGCGLLDAMDGADAVWVVDAAQPLGLPGRLSRIDAASGPLPCGLLHRSTHDFGVAEAIETARALNRLPARLVVYAIEGRNFAGGTRMTGAVRAAAQAAADAIRKELRELAACRTQPLNIQSDATLPLVKDLRA